MAPGDVEQLAERRDHAAASGARHLIEVYGAVDAGCSQLPFVSWRPLRLLFFSLLRVLLFGLFDLLFPFLWILSVIFCGREYRSLSWPYIRYAILWLLRGEFVVPVVFFRPVTSTLLSAHFRRTLIALRRRILASQSLSREQRDQEITEINQALEVWSTPTLLEVAFAYIVPVAGVIVGLLPFVSSISISAIVTIDIWLAVDTCMVAVLGTGWLTKRGLMLGGINCAAHFPAFLERPSVYQEERRILATYGMELTEFPTDVMYSFVQLIPVLVIGWVLDRDAIVIGYELGLNWLVAVFVFALLFPLYTQLPITIIAWRRRRLLARC